MARGAGEQGRRKEATSPLFATAASFLVIWVLLGGAAPENVFVFAVLALSGSVTLALCVGYDGLSSWRSLSWNARALILLFCLVPLLQLVPLPPAVWQSLPGRELPTQVLQAVGVAGEWRPLTLSVDDTLRTALVCIWFAAFVLVLLQLSARDWHRLFGILVALGLLNIAIGIVQVISANPDLQLYGNAFWPYFNGLFANKNHTGLFIVLTFLTGYIWLYGAQGRDRNRLTLVIPIGALMFVALLVTFSRAAVVLGVVALGFLVLISGGNRLTRRGGIVILVMVAAGVGLVAAIGSTDLFARTMQRFGGINSDERWLFARWSWPLVGTYFPFGSGIGSFTTVFPPHEQLAWVKPTFVNHVHDDYLEQLIELGIAAPIAWLVALIALVGPIRAAWRVRHEPRGRLALIGAAMLFLIAAHSIVDYPLRRPGIAVTFMVALAAVLRMGTGMSEGGVEGVARAVEARDRAMSVGFGEDPGHRSGR